jgi:N-acetylneuraminate synthase/N,N'-diacetyllegionaminate synthase
MNEYKNTLGCVVGYSDHTEGAYALEIAVAKGAQVLEFHFTDKREGKSFRDHKVSLIKKEVLTLIEKIHLIKSLEGNSTKKPLVSESDHVISFRRAIYPKQDLPKGTILDKSNLVFLRPNHGIDARDYDKIVGKELVEDVKKLEPLNYKSINQ